MASWSSIYLHNVEPTVSFRDGRVWITLLVDGAPSAPNTVTLMLKDRHVAQQLAHDLEQAAREPVTEGEPEGGFPRETLASA